MTWTTFFAATDDFAKLVDAMFQFDGARLFEVYSRLGHEARSVRTSGDAVRTFQLGADPNGNGIAAHCALWVPAVMPAPTRKRFDLKKGDWRESLEGCGLFWLQAGGVHDATVTESRIGWFTEAGARRKCLVTPSAETVVWDQHARVASALRTALTRLSVARAGRFPVLPHAAALHSQGHRLLHAGGIRREVTVVSERGNR